jgi:hypothetical protein
MQRANTRKTRMPPMRRVRKSRNCGDDHLSGFEKVGSAVSIHNFERRVKCFGDGKSNGRAPV